jgi:hypothetical protein
MLRPDAEQARPVNSDQVRLFGAVLGTIQAELDWERLGRAYCEGDGTTFFDDELRERWLDVGLEIGDALAQVLKSPGRSVYVGAALAEVPTMLVEALVLGREVVWVNLPGDEMEELTRVMRLASEKFGIELPVPTFEPLECLPSAWFDHVWMVSVLTDPEEFPALHDQLYERHDSKLATRRGDLCENAERAEQLLEAVFDVASDDALVTTSDEELAGMKNIARDRGFDLENLGESTVSAIVGDVVRTYRRIAASSAPQRKRMN